MKRMIKIVTAVTALVLFSVSQATHADCAVNNKSYSEGSSVGGYECQNGQWEKTG